MKKEEKKKSKKGTVLKIVTATLVVAGVCILTYKKVPKFKTFVDKILPNNTTPEIKTKPFRKYETFNKKR